MLARSSRLFWFLVAVALFALQACANGGDPGASAAAPGGAGGNGNSGAPSTAAGADATGRAGTSGAGAGRGGGTPGGAGTGAVETAGAGGAPEPMFDATSLSVVGSSGAALCKLSSDGRYLIVSVKNGGTSEVGATQVRVSTDGATFEERVATPTLTASSSAELKFDRGPLVGFVADWHFSVVIDPGGEHGGPLSVTSGNCTDLRSRADAGMVPLATWYDTNTGLWNHTDWWTSANQLETVLDYSRETGNATYFDEIDNTFVKNSSKNFDQYGFYDDDGWFLISWLKAYELTHQQKYLDMAKVIFTRMTGGWDTKCGGGIYWASAENGQDGLKNKNAIPNELFLAGAARLHRLMPGDNGPGSYLDWAQREWAWFKGSGMINADHQIVDGLTDLTNCKPDGPIFTYNQGVIIGGLVDLSVSTGDTAALSEANAIAHATMTKMATPNGILKEPGCGGDICVQFKGVFMRNLSYLYRANPLPEYQAYMRKQSDNLWNSNRNAQSEFGYEWDLPFDTASAGRQSSALDALIAAVRSGNMNLSLGASATSSAACSASQSAANALDGSSRWDSKWCSGGAGGQTLTVDLGSARYIVGFRLRHAGAGGENSAWNTRDFEIETSPDNLTWTKAVTVTGNTENVTTHPIPAVTARYARLHVTTAQTATDVPAARIYELEIYGIGL
ncbi:MAG TPA: glycoside hydrolase family 76 protein [Polyangiaceae bacterium]|jgi:predicted alpha-1,6-mannanase (GH76 family)